LRKPDGIVGQGFSPADAGASRMGIVGQGFSPADMCASQTGS
jgi:hypothetical protein